MEAGHYRRKDQRKLIVARRDDGGHDAVREGHMKIRAPKDFWSGVMFCGFAAIAILAARGYSLGSAGKMGAGYFPLLLGIVLAAMGAILIARSVVVAFSIGVFVYALGLPLAIWPSL
jgi:hypothetical protein